MATNWTTNGRDLELATKIVERAERMGLYPDGTDRTQRLMDVIAVHLNVYPLDLERWLEADDFNFMHDVFGITRHLVRSDPPTLNGHFMPRFTQKEVAAWSLQP